MPDMICDLWYWDVLNMSAGIAKNYDPFFAHRPNVILAPLLC